jgi:hypothetical protein
MARFPLLAVRLAVLFQKMITAMVVTGHRTNPFDLEGSFTVQFSADDFSTTGSPQIAMSRGFTLTVKALATTVPTIEYALLREPDGVRFEGRIECRRSLRSHQTVAGQFIAPSKSALIGKLHSSLHWDGSKGVLSATWIVPRPAAAPRPPEPAGQAVIIALPYENSVHSGDALAHGVVSDGGHMNERSDR